MKHTTIGQVSLIIAIVIVFNMFTNYAISLIYQAPVYEPYATSTQFVAQYTTAEDCLLVGGQWTEQVPVPTTLESKESFPLGYCDPEYTTRMTYEADRASYEQVVFVLLVTIGVIMVVVGFVVVHMILSPAFVWVGILSFLIASIRYWSDAETWIKVFILAAALGALIGVALKKFKAQ